MYQTHILPSGLRIIHLPVQSNVAYCGFAVNAGTRNENADEYGMAHFVEHCLFKGTKKRKAWHILNRMENVGGELNAYTTKEETLIYSVFLEEHIERAIELLSDLTFSSIFPEKEIDKEIEVVLDEINSYEDTPSELIFDDFENILFENHSLGHNILGNPDSVKSFTDKKASRFFKQYYTSANIVFFSMGKTDLRKIIRLVEKYLSDINHTSEIIRPKESLSIAVAKQVRMQKDTHQAHVVIGSRSYDFHHPKKQTLYLLNNLLGGTGMNSRLNISLREKSGLVYNVESSLNSFSDTGMFSVYFGSDQKSVDKCIRLVMKELKRLRTEKLSSNQLISAKRQLIGQLGVSSEQKENIALSMGKSFLHFNKFDSLSEIYQKIERITSDDILVVANEIFDENNLSTLVYE